MLKSKVKLPDKLSDLMVLALKDLAKCERNKKKFKIKMGTWFTPNGKCAVCFAGSVMAQSCGVGSKREVFPGDFDVDTNNKLIALDAVRAGYVGSALDDLGRSLPPGLTGQYPVVEYHHGPKVWRKQMETIAALLKAAGE